MAVIGTFGSFTAARMGIYAAQSALTVTGNNIANINTDGYTRQRLDLIALHSRGTARYANKMNLDMGYGVLTNGVSQLRDPFIDLRYRDEQAKMGASETWLEALQQMALTLDEVGDGGDFGILERQFNELFAELEQYKGAVGTPEYEATVRASAKVLCNLFNSYAEALDRVEDNQIGKLKDDVTAVNSILTRIRELSETIREGDIYGAGSLELRDERNVLIDQLSKYMKIEVSYDRERIDEFNDVERININIADTGNPPIRLVCGIYATQLEYLEYEDGSEREYGKEWLQLDPLVSAKGRVFRNSAGEPSTSVKIDDSVLQGGLQARRDFIAGKGEFSSEYEIDNSKDTLTTRGVPYYRMSLDALARKFAQLFNEANQVNFEDVGKVFKTAAENSNDPWSVDEGDWEEGTTTNPGTSEPYFVNSKGERIVLPNIRWPLGDGNYCEPHIIGAGDFEEFVKRTADLTEQEIHEQYGEQYDALYKAIEVLRQEGVLNPEYEYYNGGVLFSSSGDTNDMTGITARNITLSKSWSTREVHLLNSKEPDDVIWEGDSYEIIPHSTRNDNIAHMVNMMNTRYDYYSWEVTDNAGSGDRYFEGTFQERFADMGVTLAVDQQTTATLYDCYAINSLSLDNERQSVSGVDLNDEAMNMMTFQKSYAAACQLMTTLDSMLDKLINGTL